jgi:hypothetical protein
VPYRNEGLFLWFLASGREGLREPHVGPEGVRSTERSEPRNVATPKGARPNIMDNFFSGLARFLLNLIIVLK